MLVLEILRFYSGLPLMATVLIFLNYCSLPPPGPLAGVTWATLAWRTALARPCKGTHRDTTLGDLTGGGEVLMQ